MHTRWGDIDPIFSTDKDAIVLIPAETKRKGSRERSNSMPQRPKRAIYPRGTYKPRDQRLPPGEGTKLGVFGDVDFPRSYRDHVANDRANSAIKKFPAFSSSLLEQRASKDKELCPETNRYCPKETLA